jgi:hypothetical protein
MQGMDSGRATVVAAAISSLVALVVALAGHIVQRAKARSEQARAIERIREQLRADLDHDEQKLKAELRADFQRDRDEWRTQFMAEQVARRLLHESRWPLRSFEILQHHLGGFTENELRKILVRTGAVRFKSRGGSELWGLIERNEDRLSTWQVDAEPENVPWGELYGSAPDSEPPTD